MSRRTRRRRAVRAEIASAALREKIHDEAFSKGFDKGFETANAYFLNDRTRITREERTRATAIAQEYFDAAKKTGYDQGYEVGYQKGLSKREEYRDDSREYQRGYNLGLAAGQARSIDQVSVRNKALDEALEQCNIIAQSNPNMAPGVNAVRRQINKLRG